MPLGFIRQEDYSAGMFRGVARHLIPENGTYDLENFLLDEDGSIYKRGGSEYQSNTGFGGALRWVWDGYLGANQRTVFARSGAYGVLAGDDATPVSLGGSGLASPVRATELGGMLFIDGGTIYAGSRKAADYNTGTIAVTQGSATVTGTTTAWAANVDQGMLLQIAGSGRYYVVDQVGSDTSLTLTEPVEASTASGLTYTLTRLGTASTPYRSAAMYTTAGTKLVTGEGNRLYISAGASGVTGAFQPHVFTATEYHEIPAGARIIGIAAIRDTLIVFATNGVWAITNIALDAVDDYANTQRVVQQINADLILWDRAGIASWQNALIVPTTTGVYLIDGQSGPQALSDPIRGLLTEYVRLGYKPGLATVFNACYFLPILSAAGAPVDLLVCRLDRRVRTRLGSTPPWSRISGHASDTAAVTARRTTTGAPALVGAGEDGRVLRLAGLFDPTAARDDDADGTRFRYRVESRDFATGSGNANLVRRLKARYELVGAGTVSAFYSVGDALTGGAQWGTAEWGTDLWSEGDEDEFVQIPGQAPPDLGRNPYPWIWSGRRARYIRYRIESEMPAERFALRSAEWAVRPSGKEE